MISEKVYIEIDASSWMDAKGVSTSVFFGDSCDPCYVDETTYKELIDQEIEAHTVFDKLTGDDIGRVEEFIVALEEAVVYARKRFEELQ